MVEAEIYHFVHIYLSSEANSRSICDSNRAVRHSSKGHKTKVIACDFSDSPSPCRVLDRPVPLDREAEGKMVFHSLDSCSISPGCHNVEIDVVGLEDSEAIGIVQIEEGIIRTPNDIANCERSLVGLLVLN